MSITATTVAYIALATTAVAAGASAYESQQQGQAAAAADKRKALAEGIAGQQKQINMRQNMLKALATQNASTLGAVGTSSNSSMGANTMRQLKEGQNDLLVNSANTSSQISLLDAAASNAKSSGNIGAVADLASGGSKMAGIYGGM
jgi:hypothetical protein